MSAAEALSPPRLARLRAVAAALIPGDGASPSASRLPDWDRLLQRAAGAVGSELEALRHGLDSLPAEPSWEVISRFAETEPDAFELISTVAVGAYFMSPISLESIGWPTAPRRPAPHDQVADELGSGILEPVLARGPRVRMPPQTGGSSS